MRHVASHLNSKLAIKNDIIPAGETWMGVIEAGRTMRIVDLEGHQIVETLFYNANAPEERYSAADTIRAQGNVYLGASSKLLSNAGNTLLSIVADTCGRHDTLSGACSAENNTVRHALDKRDMHNCRDNFLLALTRWGRGMGKRDLAANINFFMNAPLSEAGELNFAESLPAAGRYVEMRAEVDVLALISNCPQLNDATNTYSPAAVQLLIWE